MARNVVHSFEPSCYPSSTSFTIDPLWMWQFVRMNGSGGSPGLVRRRIQEMQQTQLQATSSSTSSSTSHTSQSRSSYTSHDRSTSRSPSRFLTSNQRSVSTLNFPFHLRALYGIKSHVNNIFEKDIYTRDGYRSQNSRELYHILYKKPQKVEKMCHFL